MEGIGRLTLRDSLEEEIVEEVEHVISFQFALLGVDFVVEPWQNLVLLWRAR